MRSRSTRGRWVIALRHDEDYGTADTVVTGERERQKWKRKIFWMIGGLVY